MQSQFPCIEKCESCQGLALYFSPPVTYGPVYGHQLLGFILVNRNVYICRTSQLANGFPKTVAFKNVFFGGRGGERWDSEMLKVHKIENFLASIMKFVIFIC